jgi:hypothetical protein
MIELAPSLSPPTVVPVTGSRPSEKSGPTRSGQTHRRVARLTNIANRIRLRWLGNTDAGPAGLRCSWVELSRTASAICRGVGLLRMRVGRLGLIRPVPLSQDEPRRRSLKESMRAMDAPKCEKTALERGEAKTESFKTEAKHAPNGALRAVSACRSVSPLP